MGCAGASADDGDGGGAITVVGGESGIVSTETDVSPAGTIGISAAADVGFGGDTTSDAIGIVSESGTSGSESATSSMTGTDV